MRLIQGDCLEAMNTLINEGVRVDLVLTDLPYGVTTCKWDNRIPFEEMWDCINKLTHNHSPVLLFGTEPFTTTLNYSNLSDFKYVLYWIKNNSTGFLQANNKPLNNIECISVFSRGVVNHKSVSKNNRMVYNPQGLVRVDRKLSNDKKWAKYISNDKGAYTKSSFTNKEYVQKYTNYPKLTLDFDVVPKNDRLHPSQKPVSLLEYLIRTYSNPNSTVLDFCMGSGSTGIACQNTGRYFIGVELDNDYFKIAEERINWRQTTLI